MSITFRYIASRTDCDTVSLGIKRRDLRARSGVEVFDRPTDRLTGDCGRVGEPTVRALRADLSTLGGWPAFRWNRPTDGRTGASTDSASSSVKTPSGFDQSTR
jgi:hypothetical protein